MINQVPITLFTKAWILTTLMIISTHQTYSTGFNPVYAKKCLSSDSNYRKQISNVTSPCHNSFQYSKYKGFKDQ